MQPNQPDPAPRYCAACGALFSDEDGERCPTCGALWLPRSFDTVPAVATMLTELRWLWEDGLIDPASYAAARSLYERRLRSVRDRAHAAATAAATSAATAVATGPLLPWRQQGVAAQPAAPRESLGQWAAARQADILLYLGAFLLSVAALIFIGYQGETLGGAIRCLVLLLYTLAFLALGLLLPRWDRVREAGPVFLVLAALLVPANFIALRTQVLEPGGLPENLLWLLGAAVTGGLYLALAARGFGRLYAAAGALALLVAYGALGSVLGLYPDWFATWFAVGGAALAAAAPRLPGRRWLDRAALGLGGFALLAAHALLSEDGVSRWQLPLSDALALAGTGVLAWRRLVPALAALPALASLLAIAAWWSALGLEPRWWSVFFAAGGLGYLALAEADASRRDAWRVAAAGAAALALTVAYLGSTFDSAAPRQVPATWLLILGGAAWERYRGRTAGTLLLPAAAGLLVQGVLLAWDAPAVWSSYPLIGVAAALVVIEPCWSRRPPLDRIGWPYALLVALLVPWRFAERYAEHPAHGVAGFGLAAALFGVAALRSRGALARLGRGEPDARAPAIEQQSLAQISSVLVYVAAAYLNSALGLRGADRASVYVIVGVLAWAAVVAGGRRRAVPGLLPSGVAALALAGWLAHDDAGRAALILALGAAAPALAYMTLRRPLLWLAAAPFAAAALACAWRRFDLDATLYPVACALAAAVLCAALTGRRGYGTSGRDWTVTLLSWEPALYALTAAGVLLLLRIDALPAGAAPARTREWAVLALLLAGTGAAVALEGLRLRREPVAAFGSAALLTALLLSIAVLEPANVQAYTLPAGCYLLALGFAWRRSPPLAGPHLDASEAVQVAGILVAVLPAAEQAWQPGGGRFGLELIGVGLILLAAGLTTAARWLVVGGVLTLTGVALRWLLTESGIPYWLSLGVVGMTLLLLGTLLLLERERWDRLRGRIRDWWTGEPPPPPGRSATPA